MDTTNPAGPSRWMIGDLPAKGAYRGCTAKPSGSAFFFDYPHVTSGFSGLVSWTLCLIDLMLSARQANQDTLDMYPRTTISSLSIPT